MYQTSLQGAILKSSRCEIPHFSQWDFCSSFPSFFPCVDPTPTLRCITVKKHRKFREICGDPIHHFPLSQKSTSTTAHGTQYIELVNWLIYSSANTLISKLLMSIYFLVILVNWAIWWSMMCVREWDITISKIVSPNNYCWQNPSKNISPLFIFTAFIFPS